MVTQANAPTLRSNAGWPLRDAHRWNALATLPREPECPRSFANVFCNKYGLAQVGLSLCYQH